MPALSFAIPMLWREQANDITDCYFCINTRGFPHKPERFYSQMCLLQYVIGEATTSHDPCLRKDYN